MSLCALCALLLAVPCDDHEHGDEEHGHDGHEEEHHHEMPISSPKVAQIVNEFKQESNSQEDILQLAEDEAITLSESELEHQAQLYEEYIRQLEAEEH